LIDIDRSVALNPLDVTAQQHRGNVLLALNRLEDAAQAYERALKIYPQDGGIWNNYALALDALGRTNDALQAFHRAVESQPPSESAFLGLAFLELKSGRLDDAAQALDQLEKLDQHPNPVALAIRSVLARERGNAAQADALERQARALDPAAAAWAIARAGNKGQPK
jgi:tetratricopeptide (TPR) repeat protein